MAERDQPATDPAVRRPWSRSAAVVLGACGAAVALLAVVLIIGVTIYGRATRPPSQQARNDAMRSTLGDLTIPGVELGPVEQQAKCPVTSRTRVFTEDLELLRRVVGPIDADQLRAAAADEFQRRGWLVERAPVNVVGRAHPDGIPLDVVVSTESPGREAVYVWYSGPGGCQPGL